MKIAVLIQCHKNAKQLNDLIDYFNDDSFSCFVHVDKKSSIKDLIVKKNNVYILPDNYRIDVVWGRMSQVDATINLLKYADLISDFDFYILLSGQDYPLVNVEKLKTFFANNMNSNFIDLFPSKNHVYGKNNNYDKRTNIYYNDFLMKRGKVHRVIRRLWVAITGGYNHTFKLFKRKQPKMKFYFGSSWWTINNKFHNYLMEFIKNDNELLKFLKNTSCPDECFFHTVFMNSEFRDTRKEYIHYVDWSNGNSSPKNLCKQDVEKALKTDKLFARKFDPDFDSSGLQYLMEVVKK